MGTNKTKLTIGILILIILILLSFIVYSFVIKPQFTGYVLEKQIQTYNQGIEDTVFSIMQKAGDCSQVPLIFGNQTMNIIAIDCLKIQADAEI
ncbi:hypothetical protein CMI39_03450 [Candidatus Pacearchaeota archaeon]|jgi:hypothetical protein|nr:hypothetical protein [Candidatus Pacearchaeota archaeon]|tara:strand:- start:17782 stop:18060 length:279 start_codon:yes stop_codon:yes gene_type:complete